MNECTIISFLSFRALGISIDFSLSLMNERKREREEHHRSTHVSSSSICASVVMGSHPTTTTLMLLIAAVCIYIYIYSEGIVDHSLFTEKVPAILGTVLLSSFLSQLAVFLTVSLSLV